MRHFVSRLLGIIASGIGTIVGAKTEIPVEIGDDYTLSVVLGIASYALVHRLVEKYIDPDDKAS